MEYLFQNASLITRDGDILPPQDLLTKDGRIAAIGVGISSPDAEIIDCTGLYLSPSFTVLHAHSPMHILRGLAEDVSIDAWFNERIWPYESSLISEDIYWGTRLCCAEMILNGVTAFADHYFEGDEIIRAVKDSGLRIDLAPTAFGFGGDISAEIKQTRNLLRRYQGESMVSVRYGPHSPYLCSPKVLRELVDCAKEDGTGIHLHVSETFAQEENSLKQYGKSHCTLIREAGGFDIPCIAAHGLWIPPEDIPLLGDHTFIAVSPKTYLKLGMGKGTLWNQYRRYRLCIGTDGAASSNSVSPLEQARLFALLGKWEEHADHFTTTEIWRILMNGHDALPFGTGTLTAGAPADLIVWNLSEISTAPAYDPLAAILYSAGPENILHTIAAGSFLKRDGRLLLDREELLENVSRCAFALHKRGKGKTNLKF